MATSSSAAIGMAASTTNAPRMTAKPPTSSVSNGGPCHHVGCGHPNRVEDGGKGVRALGELGEAMLHEAIANDQAQWNGGPPGDRGSTRQFEGNVTRCVVTLSGLTQGFRRAHTSVMPVRERAIRIGTAEIKKRKFGEVLGKVLGGILDEPGAAGYWPRAAPHGATFALRPGD